MNILINKRVNAFLLISLSVLALMSTDLYAPSLTLIAKYFGVSDNVVQLTMGFNLLGFACLQIIIGALSDRYGRRIVLFFGLLIFFISSLICALSLNIEILIIGRFFQGVGASVMPLSALAVARDLFNEQERVKFFSIQAGIMAMVPVLAPILGSFIVVYFNWQSNFILLSVCILLAGSLSIFYFSETNQNKTTSLKFSDTVSQLAVLFKHSTFMSNAIVSALVLSGLIALITNAPIAFVKIFSIKVELYGLYYAALVLAQIGGTFFTRKLVDYISSEALLRIGLLILISGSLLAFFGAFITNFLTFYVGVFVYMFAMDSIFSPTVTIAMEEHSSMSGVASGTFGTIEMLFGSVIAFLLSGFYNESLLLLGGILVSVSVLSCFVHFVVEFPKLKRGI